MKSLDSAFYRNPRRIFCDVPLIPSALNIYKDVLNSFMQPKCYPSTPEYVWYNVNLNGIFQDWWFDHYRKTWQP